MKVTKRLITFVLILVFAVSGIACKDTTKEITADGLKKVVSDTKTHYLDASAFETEKLEIGDSFTLPSVKVYDANDNEIKAKPKVEVKDPDNKNVRLSTAGQFIPQKVGNFSFEYALQTTDAPIVFRFAVACKDTKVPTITYKTSMPTVGIIGAVIRLPQYTPSDASGIDASKSSITVQWPNNGKMETIDAAERTFTPDASGEYKVTYSVTDNAGLSFSDPYTITVGNIQAEENKVLYFDTEFGPHQIKSGKPYASSFRWNFEVSDEVVFPDDTKSLKATVEAGGYTHIIMSEPVITDLSQYDGVYFYVYNAETTRRLITGPEWNDSFIMEPNQWNLIFIRNEMFASADNIVGTNFYIRNNPTGNGYEGDDETGWDVRIGDTTFYFSPMYAYSYKDGENYDNVYTTVKPGAVALAMPDATVTGQTISWTAVPHADGYEISVDGGKTSEFITATSYQVKVSGKTEISVKAVSKRAEYKNSAVKDLGEVNVEPSVTLSDIQNLAYAKGQLTWDAVVNADIYEVSLDGGRNWRTADTAAFELWAYEGTISVRAKAVKDDVTNYSTVAELAVTKVYREGAIFQSDSPTAPDNVTSKLGKPFGHSVEYTFSQSYDQKYGTEQSSLKGYTTNGAYAKITFNLMQDYEAYDVFKVAVKLANTDSKKYTLHFGWEKSMLLDGAKGWQELLISKADLKKVTEYDYNVTEDGTARVNFFVMGENGEHDLFEHTLYFSSIQGVKGLDTLVDLDPIENIAYSPTGELSWDAVKDAQSYQISFDNGVSWKTTVNTKEMIKGFAGTVKIRAYTDDGTAYHYSEIASYEITKKIVDNGVLFDATGLYNEVTSTHKKPFGHSAEYAFSRSTEEKYDTQTGSLKAVTTGGAYANITLTLTQDYSAYDVFKVAVKVGNADGKKYLISLDWEANNVTIGDADGWTLLTFTKEQIKKVVESETNATTDGSMRINFYVRAEGGGFDIEAHTLYFSSIQGVKDTDTADLGPIENITYSPTGELSWNAVTGAQSYQISFDNGVSWKTTVNTKEVIKGFVGTVKMRAYADDGTASRYSEIASFDIADRSLGTNVIFDTSNFYLPIGSEINKPFDHSAVFAFSADSEVKYGEEAASLKAVTTGGAYAFWTISLMDDYAQYDSFEFYVKLTSESETPVTFGMSFAGWDPKVSVSVADGWKKFSFQKKNIEDAITHNAGSTVNGITTFRFFVGTGTNGDADLGALTLHMSNIVGIKATA